jgi:hypothetical protein
MDCWKYKNCGCDGKNAEDCPAYPNHGRRCASIPNTRCNGATQDTLSAKLLACLHCDFRRSAHYENGI